MAYTKTNWENSPSTNTPISAANLNNIEDGVEAADTHASTTLAVHGISNTANLVYTNDSRLSDQRVPTDASVTKAKFASTVALQSFNAQIGTTYTLALSDADFGVMVTLNNSGAITLTVPTAASVAFPVGATINLVQIGAGQVTVVGDTGVTVSSQGGKTKTNGQYAVASLVKLTTDGWLLFGNVAS